MTAKREVMCEAHRMLREYKAGKIRASSDRFSFFLKCAQVLRRMRAYQLRRQ